MLSHSWSVLPVPVRPPRPAACELVSVAALARSPHPRRPSSRAIASGPSPSPADHRLARPPDCACRRNRSPVPTQEPIADSRRTPITRRREATRACLMVRSGRAGRRSPPAAHGVSSQFESMTSALVTGRRLECLLMGANSSFSSIPPLSYLRIGNGSPSVPIPFHFTASGHFRHRIPNQSRAKRQYSSGVVEASAALPLPVVTSLVRHSIVLVRTNPTQLCFASLHHPIV